MLRGVWFGCFLFSFSLETFLEQIFSQTNQKMKTIFFRFQHFQLKTRKNENAVIFPILFSLFLFFFLPQIANPQSLHFLSLLFFSLTWNHSLTPLSIDPAPSHHYHHNTISGLQSLGEICFMSPFFASWVHGSFMFYWFF